MHELSQSQKAIQSLIGSYSAFPIDKDHLKVEMINDNPCLVFDFDARSDEEFSVEVRVFSDEYQIACDGWHEHYGLSKAPDKNAEHITEQLITLFNGSTKLVTYYKGENPYRWELLYNFDEDEWESLGVTGLLFYNYFAKRKIMEHSNKILDRRVHNIPIE